MHRGRALIVCGLASVLVTGVLLAPSAHAARPRNGTVLWSPPLLNWTSVSGARVYNVQLWRDGRKILSRFPVRSRLELSRRWTYRGRDFRLSVGVYRWYVWPWFGRRFGRVRVKGMFIVGRVPRTVALPVVTGKAREGATLSTTQGQWRGSRPIARTYSWQRCDGAGCVAIPGANGAAYTVRATDIDRTIRAVVTGTNLAGARSARSARTAVVLPRPPTNNGRPTVAGAPQQGRLLTALLGTWQSSRPITFRIAWLRCDHGGNCVRIATAATYRLAPADFGNRLRIRVTAANTGGAATALSPPSPRIGRRYVGGGGDDLVRGSPGADVLRGLGGHDTLFGLGGPDEIFGGPGNDRLIGGAGADMIQARDALRDAVYCGGGDDTVVADRRDKVDRSCERVRR